MSTPSLKQLTDLSQKVALVTGAAAGIGRHSALRLAEAGARVVVADIDRSGAEATAAAIRQQGGSALALRDDVSQPAQAEQSVQAAVAEYGRLDILLNNAGVFPFSPALDIDEARWDKVLDLNLKGAFFHAQAAAKQMIKQGGGGRIINIASVDAIMPVGGLAHYDASKGALVMLTKSLAKEWGAHGITVNAIAPGGVNTPGAQQAMAKLGADASKIPARSVFGRMAEPDEIARVVFFLASGLSDYMSGSLVVVDGGYLLM